MKKRAYFFKVGFILWMMICLNLLPITSNPVFAQPANQNFDSVVLGSTGTQSYTLNGVIYTTNDAGGLPINIANDGNIASGSDHALAFRSSNVNTTTLVSFRSADGSEFKLNSFVLSTGVGDQTVTIRGYRDNSLIISDTASTATFTVFDVSANINWQNIDEVRITGNDLDIDLDDISFSPAVPPTYTVTYNGNGSTGGSVPTDATSYHNGDLAAVLGNTGTLTRTGYVFSGWNTAAGGGGTAYSPTDTFSIGASNVTLYAQWTPLDYSVTYNGNTHTGGTVPTDGTVYHITNTVSVLSNSGSLVKTGYTFAGWNTVANGSGTSYSSGNTFAMGSSNVTLYAQWTENTYSVTYNGNGSTGGSVPTDATSYHNGDTATVLGNTGSLTRTGYVFSGWNTAAGGGGTAYSPTNTFSIGLSNVTLYAQWTPLDYSVTYNGNTHTGGTVPTDGTVYHITNTVSVLSNSGSLVKTGYTFAGWNTAANGSGTSYSSGNTFAMGSSNITLYAQWTENTYSVTYNGNGSTGGSVPTDATSYHNGDTATVLGNTGALIRTGYVFSGWNTAAGGGGTAYSPTNTFSLGATNVTLYAQWTPVDYSVTYNGNTHTGGTVPIDGTVYHITNTVSVLSNSGSLVKTGYTFAGWNTAADGSGTTYAPAATFNIGGASLTLYAKWNLISASSGSGSSGNSGNGNPSQAATNNGAQVLFNGFSQNAGTSNTVQTGGVLVTTVSLDVSMIDQKIVSEPNGSTVTIPVVNDSSVVIGQLNGQTIKNMENKDAVLEIKTADSSYTLPAQQINITDVSNQLGESVALKDITVSIEISHANLQMAQFVESVASKGNFMVVVNPVAFTVKCTHGDRTVEVNSFNAYVERTIAIPEGVDPTKVTTGVVIGADGNVNHVPTRIVVIEGKYFAKINSLTNSLYTLVNHSVVFKDIENHWSKNIVNDMASRMIVDGTKDGEFQPNKLVSHAEFVDLLVKSMGLTKNQTKIVFKNVNSKLITRQEAANILEEAFQLVGIKSELSNHEVQAVLKMYKDGKSLDKGTATAVAICIKEGIIKGSNKEIRPNQKLTRAEAVVMLSELLKRAKLI